MVILYCCVVNISVSLTSVLRLSRPYSKDMGYEDVDVSAILVVRYVLLFMPAFFFFVCE